ncbi:MAG TPA: hypothetical protein VF371_09625, partial [Candidatus Limnocylindrales bacterium]
ALSPQSRRGHAVPPSHRKPAPRVPSDAARKPATSAAAEGTAAGVGSAAEAASTVTPKVSASVSPSSSGKAAKGKAGSRPTERKAAPAARRGRSLVRVGRNSTLRNIYSYLKAYVPLFIAFALIFAVVWAWSSYGPHTNTPRENWTKIESTWKPKRAADLTAVSTAVAANDFNAAIKGYTAVRDDTKGWMDALGTIKSWDDAAASANPGGTATQFVQQLVAAGNAEVGVLDQVVAAKSMDGVLALKDQLDAADQTFVGDYAYAPTIFGVAPAASGEPTLALPSGSLSPSGSPDASAVPGSSAAPSAAASASATPS